MTRRRCLRTGRSGTVSALLILAFLASSSGAQTGSIPGLSGRWEADRVPSGPWVLDLTVTGNTVTGRIMQHGGIPGPSAIYDGKTDGATVTFKSRNPLVTQAVKEVTYTGRLVGRDLAFERSVEITLNEPNDGTLAVPLARGTARAAA